MDRGFIWPTLVERVHELEQARLVTRTFRRLDPERQVEVITAILDEAAEVGLAHVNIKQVAARAKVAVGSLYQYFGNRETMTAFALELSLAHMQQVFSMSSEQLAALPLRPALLGYVLGGCEWAKSQPSLMRLFAKAAYGSDPALSERLVRPVAILMRQMVHSILEGAQARGELREDVDLDAAATIVHALTVVVSDTRLLPHLDAYFLVGRTSRALEGSLDAAITLIEHGIGATKNERRARTRAK